MKSTETIMRDLAKPFPPKYIHENPSGGGSYIKHHVIEQRLIQVFGSPPPFELVQVVRGHVPELKANPQAKSKRGKEGRPALEDAIVGVVARLTVRWPETDTTTVYEEAGDCEEPHNWTSDGQRLKDAMSDAYKRCAMRLGCGLHLWSQDEYFLFNELTKDSAGGTSTADSKTPVETSAPPSASPEPTGEGVTSPPSGADGESSTDGFPPSTPNSGAPLDAGQILSRWSWEQIKPVAREIALQHPGHLVPLKVEQLGECDPAVIQDIAAELETRLPA